jgi:hypothetical protein
MRSGGPLITYSPVPRHGDFTTVPRGQMPERCDPGMLLPLDDGSTVLLLTLSDWPTVLVSATQLKTLSAN